MNLSIDRAVYGEKEGAHSLLGTNAPAQSRFRELAFHTDRVGNLPLSASWAPYEGGFPFGDHYVIHRTFPDLAASRAGMVRTYVLVADLEKIGALPDLGALIRLLPHSPSP